MPQKTSTVSKLSGHPSPKTPAVSERESHPPPNTPAVPETSPPSFKTPALPKPSPKTVIPKATSPHASVSLPAARSVPKKITHALSGLDTVGIRQSPRLAAIAKVCLV